MKLLISCAFLSCFACATSQTSNDVLPKATDSQSAALTEPTRAMGSRVFGHRFSIIMPEGFVYAQHLPNADGFALLRETEVGNSSVIALRVPAARFPEGTLEISCKGAAKEFARARPEIEHPVEYFEHAEGSACSVEVDETSLSIIILSPNAMLTVACRLESEEQNCRDIASTIETGAPPTLLEKREGHSTQLISQNRRATPPSQPPNDFELIQFESKLGKLWAYLAPSIDTNKPRPAIIWLSGGFPGTAPGPSFWGQLDTENDQSARPYREAGITMMVPFLRGRANNPGQVEQFYGEVEDVISAYKHLLTLKYVDPEQIYLGGHSTGGTLALLVAASTDKFAGVISFGPVDTDYGPDDAPYEWSEKERYLRHPIRHLSSIKSQTLVIEGSQGNSDALAMLKSKQHDPMVKFLEVRSGNHFNVLYPLNVTIAAAIDSSREAFEKLTPKMLQESFDAREQNLRLKEEK